MKFVYLSNDNGMVSIKIDTITSVYVNDKVTRVCVLTDKEHMFAVKESVDEVMKRIDDVLR